MLFKIAPASVEQFIAQLRDEIPEKYRLEKSFDFDKFCFRHCEIDRIETNCESFSRLVFEVKI